MYGANFVEEALESERIGREFPLIGNRTVVGGMYSSWQRVHGCQQKRHFNPN